MSNRVNTILRLQRLQNWAARIIFIVDRRHESSPLLKCLHWLPVKQRITYKLLLYVYKALNGLAPMYISNCLKLYVPKRNLRSSSNCLCLDYPITRNKAGDRSFTVYASKLWNNLPMTLRNCTSVSAFKKALTTHLFPNNLFSLMFISYYVCLLFYHFCKRPEPFGNGVSNT